MQATIKQEIPRKKNSHLSLPPHTPLPPSPSPDAIDAMTTGATRGKKAIF